MDARFLLSRSFAGAFGLTALALLFFFTPLGARAQPCRDATGEIVPCAAAPVVTTSLVAPAVDEPVVEPPSRRAPDAPGYFDLTWYVDLVDPSTVTFTPDAPATIPEIERGTHLGNVAPGFDRAFGGLTLGGGYRPVPWLRLPDLRVSLGYADFEGAPVTLEGGPQALVGAMRDVWNVRLQIGGGLDLRVDIVRLFALAHFSVGGYFASVDVGGSSIGELGRDTFSALSLEAGWTAGIEIEIVPDLSYTIGYRHTHTGVEQNTLFFGIDVALR